MRKTFRKAPSKVYWENRWGSVALDGKESNPTTYPLKYAEFGIRQAGGGCKVLEIGCGAGRVLRYFHRKGIDISGIDYIEAIVARLKKLDDTLKVEVGDVVGLRFGDSEFDCVFSFGVYHNLENDVSHALNETFRVLKDGGVLCASFRADNLQTRINDWLEQGRAVRTSKCRGAEQHFHKLNFSANEFRSALEEHGFDVVEMWPVTNMPILYKFRIFRCRQHKNFNEALGRKEGYRLNVVGRILQGTLMAVAPHQFCNINVCIAKKPQGEI